MGKDTQDIRQLMGEGKSCSQVMIQMTMRKLGIEDEHLIRAARGLSTGMGIRHACGILTGIACGMSLADEKLGYNIMFPELFKWFYETYGDDHGGVLCAELLDGDDGNRRLRCPEMIDKTWEKACEILEDNGFGS